MRRQRVVGERTFQACMKAEVGLVENEGPAGPVW